MALTIIAGITLLNDKIKWFLLSYQNIIKTIINNFHHTCYSTTQGPVAAEVNTVGETETMSSEPTNVDEG